jgi:hypothetical protein
VTVIGAVPRPHFRGLRAVIKEARKRQRRRQMLLALVLVVAASVGGAGYAISNAASSGLLASGCATSKCASVGASATGIPNPCALLTDAAAATALGTTGIESRDSQVPSGMSSHYRMCTWTGTPLTSTYYSNSTVTVMAARSTRLEFLKDERASRESIVIHGLGQAAYAWVGPATFVYVFQHGYMIQIQVSPAVNPLQAEKKLAKLALTRLP